MAEPAFNRRGVLGLLGGAAASAAQVIPFPQASAPGNPGQPGQPYAATPQEPEDDGDYFDLTRLRRQYYDYLGAADAEIKEAREARHYYHGSQWTAEEIAVLQRRKQPVITSNRIVRKIDAVVGLVEKLRQDPKAYARTPKHEKGAELATAVMRYVLDSSDWKSKSVRIARLAAIDGVGGVEFDLEQGNHGDPELGIHIVYGDTFFYDKRSFDEGFTDARYMGVAKWVDVELAKELFPDKAEEIDGLIELGSDLATASDLDRERTWINVNEKRVRLIDHWYIKGGKWRYCAYIANTMLMQGISPFQDNKGKTFPRFLMFSASVDHDGDRYGFVRNLKSPQDEINHRRSKALHFANMRSIITPKGAFDDIEVARKELSRPDGVTEYNLQGDAKPEFDDARRLGDMKAQLEFLQEAKNEIENFGPNPALIGQGLEDSSGRAINLLQQAGLAELGPFLSAHKTWKIRVYRAIWNIVTHSWKAERWIRVTDDDGVAQFLQINKLDIGPDGMPQLVNAIGSLDVDIIVDEGPDSINMQADNYATVQALGPAFAQENPDVVIELSPLDSKSKKTALERLEKKMNTPPPPDPKVKALADQAQLNREEAMANFQLEQQKAEAALVQREREFQLEMKLETVKAHNLMQLKREEAANQFQIERMKVQMGTPEKPPSESINFKDIPPEAQSQMLAQAGISISPETMAAHTAEVAAREQAAKRQPASAE